MNHFKNFCALSVLSSLTLNPISQAAEPNTTPNTTMAKATVTVEAGSQGKRISSDLFGIFFEDINYAADGGLYAELIQNRSFEYSPRDNRAWNSLTAWELVERGGGKGSVKVESAISLHANNPQYAVLNVEQAGGGVGLANSGFDGIAVKAGEKYDFSLFARRASGQPLPIMVQLEGKNGTVYSKAILNTLTNDWMQYKVTLQPTATDSEARLVLIAQNSGSVALDMVSLFPQKTFKNRPNGLRDDLAQVIADLKPRFVRFPGGCLAHGDGINNIYHWKSTIGPVERRKGQRNIWNYHQSAGLGYFEYFQFCEDIGAKPLPVVAAGVSCQNSFQQWGVGQQCIPLANMDEYIQDVLDLVEWANGPVTSFWGAKRAAAGHPAPFNLQYLGVGNEDHITPEFRQRFEMINKAVKAKYPKITVIGTVGPFHSGFDYDEGWKIANQLKLEMVDEHYYEAPDWFLRNLNRYDTYDRTKSKVYLGEYASRGNTLYNALSEAAYMASLERNGDVVHLSSYAPLLARKGRTQWNPDLIYFDGTSVAPTVNYYVQQLFAHHAGDFYLPNTVSFTPVSKDVKPVGIFLGTWNTQAQFDDVKLESGTTKILEESFSAATPAWNGESGTWSVSNGVYNQGANAEPALARIANVQVVPVNGNLSYTYALRARKTGGEEGFLIGFGAVDTANYYWWNVGGWKNTQHAIEKRHNGASSIIGAAVPGAIETNRWYDIKIVVNGSRIQCFLDGKLIHNIVDQSPTENFVVSSVRDETSGDLILKMINPAATPVQSQINLNGIKALQLTATKIVLSGDPAGQNTFANPRNILPQTEKMTLNKTFSYLAPPHSFTVMRLKTR